MKSRSKAKNPLIGPQTGDGEIGPGELAPNAPKTNDEPMSRVTREKPYST